MTGNFDINKELLDAMRIIARQEIERCNRDITKTARVVAVNADKTVKIEMDGKQYNNIPNYNGTTLAVNDIVKVTYPQGQTSNMYVSGGGGDEIYSILSQKANISDLINVSNVAAEANGKVQLIGPIKIIAYAGDGSWSFQQQYSDGNILSLNINDTQIAYDYYDGKNWTRKWTK